MVLKFDKETLRYNIKTSEGKRNEKRNGSKDPIHRSDENSKEVEASGKSLTEDDLISTPMD